MESKYLNFEKALALNYKKIGLSDDEYLLLSITYELTQTGTKFVNPQDLALLCSFSTTKIDVVYSGLISKNMISSDFDSSNAIYTSFKGVTEKLVKVIFDDNNSNGNKIEKNEEDDIYTYLQNFFGRVLTSLEYDVIQSWKIKQYPMSLIKAACDICAKIGNKSIRYIDTIIYEENRKNQMGDEEYQKRQQETIELSKVDWLNK